MCCRKKVRLQHVQPQRKDVYVDRLLSLLELEPPQFRLLLDNQLQTHLLPLPIRKIAAFFEACHFASHRSHQSHNCTVCCLLIFRIGWMSLIPGYFSVRVLLREKLVFELSQLKVHFMLRPTAIQPRLLTFPFRDEYSLRCK